MAAVADRNDNMLQVFAGELPVATLTIEPALSEFSLGAFA